MKKLVTALLLAASALSPATAMAMWDTNAYVSSAVDVEVEATTSPVSLNALIDSVVHDVELDGDGLSIVEDNRYRNESALDAYCADETLEAVARINLIDNRDPHIGDSGLDGPYALWLDNERGFFDIVVDLGPDRVTGIKDLYEKEEWMYVDGNGDDPMISFAKYEDIQGESDFWATFPDRYLILNLHTPGDATPSYIVTYVPELDSDQSAMFHELIIFAGPRPPC